MIGADRRDPATRARDSRALPGAIAIAVLCLTLACGGESGSGGAAQESSDTGTSAASQPPAPAYRESDSLTAGYGDIAVKVTVSDTLLVAVDTIVYPIRDFDACGAELVDRTVLRTGSNLANAVVWLRGVAEGKQGPLRKRHDLTSQSCLVSPRVQAVVAGGTLNVRNLDNAVHVLRFTDATSGQVVARITQSQRGQVVPIDYLLLSPAIIEVTCEIHPWTRGWIHVFSHPYFAVTDRNGAATMDSVPAGEHHLMVWHERFQASQASVEVTAGKATDAAVAVGGR